MTDRPARPGEMRLLYTDPGVNKFHPVMQPDPGDYWPQSAVIAVVGPFDNHTGQMELQRRLLEVVRQWNAEIAAEVGQVEPQDDQNTTS